jgi:probable F420-dependent oxidoreductase
MKFGMSVIVRGDNAAPATFDAMAKKAEETGLETLWTSDHLIIPKLKVSKYPGRADGQFPDPWKRTYWQPFSVLTYLAAKTTKVRLGTSVLILPMRNPIEVAAQVGELDVLSGGRINFGVGVGWFVEETETLGYPFKLRGRRCNEGLEICQALWNNELIDYQGKFYQIEGASFGPKPTQKGGPPVYVGGNSEGALKRTAKYADVWHPFKVTPEQIAELKPVLARLREAEGKPAEMPICPKIVLGFENGGRKPGQVPTEGSVQEIVDALKRYEDVGCDDICFDIMDESEGNALRSMERLADEIRPKLG